MKYLAIVTPAVANVSHTAYFDNCMDATDERTALVLAYTQRGMK